MTHSHSISFLGYCSGMGAENTACCMGPLALQTYFLEHKFAFPTEWVEMLYPKESERRLAAIPAILELSERLARHTCEQTALEEDFVVFGGDHTSAIGAWSGVAHAVHTQGNLGLIWIDAHMDSHTPDSTPSQNMHGMPLAVLLGHGDPRLTEILHPEPKILPQNLCLIGVRSFEGEEAELLKQLGVRIFHMPEVQEKGMENVLKEAIAIVKKNTVGFGISLDLDAIDPKDAPGTGVTEPNGILATELCNSFTQCLKTDAQLLGIEISEYNPSLDIENRTAKLVQKIVTAIYG